MKVFIVEDSPIVCERLRNMIDGIQNIEFIGDTCNAEDAVRDIYAAQPDMMILGLDLASGRGLEVLHQIKSQPFSCMAIVLTNYAYPQYLKKCMELGADYFLDKALEIEMRGKLLTCLSKGPRLLRKCANL